MNEGVDACEKTSRDTRGVTALIDMLRLRKSPTCIQVGGRWAAASASFEPQTLLLSLVVLPMGANRTALVSPSQEPFLEFSFTEVF
jgi:hypothetical protein